MLIYHMVLFDIKYCLNIIIYIYTRLSFVKKSRNHGFDKTNIYIYKKKKKKNKKKKKSFTKAVHKSN